MRIAYFTDSFLPQVNGIATSLANQARQLGEEGHQILIFTPKMDHIKRKRFQAKNVRVVSLPTLPFTVYTELKLGIFGFPKIIRYLKSFDPDIIHVHTPFTVGVGAVIVAKIFKKPLVGSLHVYLGSTDYMQQIIKRRLAAKLLGRFVNRYFHFIYSQCDLVISPSQIAADALKRYGFKKKIVNLPNAVSLNKVKALTKNERDNFKKKYNLKDKVILHFGRISHEKKVDQLILSFADLKKRHPDISLLIIGDGPASKNLQKLTRKLQLDDVIFTGFIDHQHLISSGLPGVGDVFATASTMENQPMVVLEAMLFGLPVVGVKQAGLIELVKGNGFLVESGDIAAMSSKLEQILTDGKLAKKLGGNSLNLIENHSVKNTSTRLISLYNSLNINFTSYTK